MINLTEEKTKKIDFRIKVFTITVSSILFISSLTQIAFHVKESDHLGQYSLCCLLVGWTQIFGPGISWLATPALIISWMELFKDLKKAFFYAIAALILSSSFMLFTRIKLYNVMDKSEILSLGLGYWFWLFSCFINLVGVSILYSKSINSR